MNEDTIGSPGEPQLVRLALPDRPGGLALVANRFAAHEVNILRVEVVEGGDGSAVDDLLVVGGNLALALEELGEDVEILGLREHAELPDPGIAMADALAGISGAASLGAAGTPCSPQRSSSSPPTAACCCATPVTAGSGPLPPRRSRCRRSGGRALSRSLRHLTLAGGDRRDRRSRGLPSPTSSRSAWAAS